MFDNTEEQRFDFEITVVPRSRGDFGSARIGGQYRELKECYSAAQEMMDEIVRHVYGVEYCYYTVQDVYDEYAGLPGWKVGQLKNKPWENVKKELPEKDHTDYKVEMKSVLESILRSESPEDMYQTAKEALEAYFPEEMEDVL